MIKIKTTLIFLLTQGALMAQSQAVQPYDVTVIDRNEMYRLIKIKDDTLRLFNFWATWCKPCVQELPYFEQMNQEMSQGKFRQYLISLDFNEGQNKRLVSFIEKNKLRSTVLLFDGGDPNQWIDSIHPEWSGTIPASLLVYQEQKCFFEGNFKDLSSLKKYVLECKNNHKI